jgi:hypothetical protein
MVLFPKYRNSTRTGKKSKTETQTPHHPKHTKPPTPTNSN